MVKIEDKEIVIRIPIDALEFALQKSEYGKRYWESSGGKDFEVTDPEGFAEDVIGWMTDEREDGSTIVTDMIDQACETAIEFGSEHVFFEDDDE